MRSHIVIALAATTFVLFLVRHERNARELLRAEERALERVVALAKGPPGPPHIEAGYRFRWVEGGQLPSLLLAIPEEGGICLFAAAQGSAYSYDLFGGNPPDVTPLRVHVARAAEGQPLPPGWRPVR